MQFIVLTMLLRWKFILSKSIENFQLSIYSERDLELIFLKCQLNFTKKIHFQTKWSWIFNKQNTCQVYRKCKQCFNKSFILFVDDWNTFLLIICLELHQKKPSDKTLNIWQLICQWKKGYIHTYYKVVVTNTIVFYMVPNNDNTKSDNVIRKRVCIYVQGVRDGFG